MVDVIQIGVDSVDGDFVLDGFHDDPFDVVFAIESLESTEDDGVVGDDEVAPFVDSFIEDGFYAVEAEEDAGDFRIGVTYDETRVVVGFLVGGWGDGFEVGCDVFYCHDIRFIWWLGRIAIRPYCGLVAPTARLLATAVPVVGVARRVQLED